MNKNSTLFYVLFFSLLTSPHLEAKEPTLEIGIGLGVLHYPDYIGSKNYQTLVTPFPHLRYRGDLLRLDEDGLSGKLFGVNGLRLDLSVNASLPADSSEGNIRDGMPDLDLTGEIGVQFIYEIYKNCPYVLELELPIRAVLSTDFTNLVYRGIVSNPQLKLALNYSAFEWTFRSGIMLTNSQYNNYYYGVQEEYVTPTRALYDAKGGFSGFRQRIGLTYQKNAWWGGLFLSHYSIVNAVFHDSPLVESHETSYFGISLAYIFYMQD